jgi:hypothetical protein
MPVSAVVDSSAFKEETAKHKKTINRKNTLFFIKTCGGFLKKSPTPP